MLQQPNQLHTLTRQQQQQQHYHHRLPLSSSIMQVATITKDDEKACEY